MLKFMLLDLFNFRSVGSKPKTMKMMDIFKLIKIMTIINCDYMDLF